MAKKSGLSQQFYFEGVDMSGDVGSIDNVSTPRGTQDVTGLSRNAHEFLTTQSDGQISWSASFNAAPGA